MNCKTYLILVVLVGAFGCKITQAIKNGQMAYDLKQYAVAIPMLEKEYTDADSKADKGQKAKLLGDCYDYKMDYLESSRWYEKAAKHYVNVMPKLASAYKKSEQYAKARDKYQALCKSTGERKWCIEAALCERALEEPTNTQVQMSTFAANSPYAEYGPVFYGEDFLVFTSDREESLGDEVYNWTGNAFSDLYVLNLKGQKVNNFDAIINSAANEGTACFSQDLNEIFFTRCESINLRDQYCRLYFSQRPNGFWMEPEPLMFFDERTNVAHATLVENDSVLIFSAAPYNSDGTYDLYYSERVEGGWSAPDLMPTRINSAGNEKFASSYGDTLFFASDGLPGYGGYDIFKTYLGAQGWTNPENMGRPINSGADDFSLAVDVAGTRAADIALQGYLSSSRNIGTGDDIFFFSIAQADQDSTDNPQKETPTEEKKKKSKIFIAVRVVELIHEDNDPNKPITDRLPLPGAKIVMNRKARDVDVKTDKKGFFIRELSKGESLVFTASKPGYLSMELLVNAPSEPRQDTTINVELSLDKIVYDKEIVLENIYYDYDKWDIREDARPSLDSLGKILALNPEIFIQLGSHTDCQGPEEYNEVLSQKRAASAKDYLVSQGVALTRIASIGYGESSPIDKCTCDDCSEDQHQLNRRTSFKIVKER